MSANQYVEEALIRHQVYLLRYSGTASRKVKAVLDNLMKSVNKVLLSESLTDYQLARYNKLRTDVEQIISNMPTKEIVIDSATDLATYEAGFIEKLYQGAVNVQLSSVAVDRVIATVTSTPVKLLQGDKYTTQTINQLVDTFDRDVSKQVLSTIQTGILEGKPLSTVASEVSRLSKSQLYRNAEALTRTVNLHVGNVARQAFYEQNDDVIDHELFVATLDSRTTLICAGYDGDTFKIGQGPQPPLHYRCRSVRVAIIDPGFGIDSLSGQRPQVGSDGPGVTSAKTTFNSFFGRQSKEWQKDYLGPKRYKLYKSGRLNIDSFTDDLGRTLTLEELVLKEGLTL